VDGSAMQNQIRKTRFGGCYKDASAQQFMAQEVRMAYNHFGLKNNNMRLTEKS
jgi:hypothetical protein